MTFFTLSSWIFFGTLLATALIAYPFRVLALRVGMVDYPDQYRKLHRQPIPVGGGLVIFLIMALTVVILSFLQPSLNFGLRLSPNLMLPICLVTPFIVGIGLIDDRRGMSGKTKLFCQVVAASVIVGFAKYYSEISYFGIELKLHHLFYPLAVFWIIGMINAINLLDGVDGVAVTVSFFMFLATACMAYLNNHPGIAIICIGMAGCLAGFFMHNRPPAGIYLGDTGSMLIGLALGTLMLRASVLSDRTIFVCGPLAIAMIPAVDSLFAVIRRVNSGRTIFSPDRGHIQHLLVQKSSSTYRVLLILSLLVLPGCVGAVCGVYFRSDWIPAAAALFTLVVAIAGDVFGRRELFILFGRAKGRFRKLFHKEKYLRKRGEVYHIQGKGPWREIWNRLVESLMDYPCRCLQLDINLPHKNEDFFGEWENVARAREERYLVCFSALMMESRRVGTLRLYFDDWNGRREELLELTATLASICEETIKQYLDTGMLDKSFSILLFEKLSTERKSGDGEAAKRAA